MELIILNDGLYQLIPVTKQMMDGIVLTSEVDCFELCDILRLKLTGYEESQRKLEEIGREDINKYGMYIKFTCRIDDSI